MSCDLYRRPYRIPLPNWAVTLMLLPADGLLLTILFMPIVRGDWQMIAWTVGCMILGLVLYPVLQLARKHEWFEFTGVSPHEFRTNLYSNLPYANGSAGSRPVLNGAPVMTAAELHVGQPSEPLVAAAHADTSDNADLSTSS